MPRLVRIDRLGHADVSIVDQVARHLCSLLPAITRPAAEQLIHASTQRCMLVCMRATINLPDALAEAAKERARSEGRTFTSLVEEGLRTVLAHDERPAKVEPLPAYGDTQGRFLVDITDHDALWTALDADDRR